MDPTAGRLDQGNFNAAGIARRRGVDNASPAIEQAAHSVGAGDLAQNTAVAECRYDVEPGGAGGAVAGQ